MSWLGMSIPTLPGTARRPGSEHPGAKNMEREEEKKKKNQTDSQDLPDKQTDKPDDQSHPEKTSKDNS